MDIDRKLKKYVCWKCRYLVTEHGFLKREKKTGPCDRCLGKMTIFQMAWEKDIWIKYIPKKKSKQPKNEKELIEKSKDTRSLNSDSKSSK